MAEPLSVDEQQTHLQRLQEHGYTILENALSDAVIEQIRGELSPYLQGELMGRNDFEGLHSERVYALLAKAPTIARMVEHPDALSLIDATLKEGHWLSAALAINVHPGETPQDWHRDDGAGGHHLPMPRPPLGVSTIWALDDFTEDNGATEVIPGSHLWAADRQPQPAEAVKVIMRRGSVLVFYGNLLHRGGANRSRTKRLAITPQYCVRWLRQIENMTLAVPPDTAGQYSERIQQLLGYSVIDPGFMGYVDGVHPRRLIDRSYKGRKHRSDLPSS